MNIPNHIALLQLIATHSQKNDALFTPSSARFKAVKKTLSLKGHYNNAPEFTQNPDAILITQLVALTALSMVGGITMPIIKQLSIQENTLKLNWGNQVIDSITLGQYDSHYTQFCRTLQQKISGDSNAARSFHRPFMKDCQKMISHYKDIFTKIDTTLQKLITSKIELKTLFSKDIQPDLFFILLSSLPINDINAFLLHMQSFLPEDLELKQSDGHSIKVTTLFQSPSSDIQYLITKIHIYLSLYYSTQLPIIRHITQSKSPSFLNNMLDNQTTYTTLVANITSLRETQLQSRLNIYTLFTVLLQKLEL